MLLVLVASLCEPASGVTVEPGVIFQPSASWTNISFAERQTFSTIDIDATGVTFDSARLGVQKFPSGLPRASIQLTAWSPLQAVVDGTVLRFLGDAATGSTLYFDVSNVLLSREYVLQADGIEAARRFSDASGLVSFVWANWSVHDLHVLLGPGSGPPAPVPLAADFTYAPATPSVGEAIAFSASVAGGTPPYDVTWDFGDGATATGLSSTHAYDAEGDYVVTLLATDQGSQSRTVGKTVRVSVTPPPPGTLSATFSLAPSNPRVGDRIAFAASASGGSPPYAFSWDFGDGGSASGNLANHSYGATGSYTVTLTVTDAASGLDVESRSLVIDRARLVGNVTAAFDVVITDRTVRFVDRSVSEVGADIVTWLWVFGDGASSNATEPTHEYDVAGFSGTFTALLYVTDAEGNVGSAEREFTIVNAPLVVGVGLGAAAAVAIAVLVARRRRRKDRS